MRDRYSIYTLLLLTALLVGCDGFEKVYKGKGKIAQNDVLLASVEDKDLYFSEIDEMLSAKSQSDSLNQLNAYIESWIKRSVLLSEAEINFPESIDINELVEDYKSSLLLHNYRQILIAKELDTIVTNEQEKVYYETNKEQYRLRSRICKGKIASIPESAPRMEKFYKSWKKDESLVINSYLEEYGETKMVGGSTWYTANEFLSLLPQGLFKNSDIKNKGDLQKNNKGYEYFVKITNVIDENEIAPLSYVKESIKKLILHQRKKQLLDNIEQNIYQKYLGSNRIKIHTTK